MAKKPKLPDNIATRLRAIIAYVENELGERVTLEWFANSYCEASKSVLNEWLRMSNTPPVSKMMFMSDKLGLTLDWIYRGQLIEPDEDMRSLVETLDTHIRTGAIKEKVKRAAST